MTISRGSSGLPVSCAGQTDVHRPQMVQASVSSNCFQVNSVISAAPDGLDVVGLHQVGDRTHCPLGALVGREEHVRRRGEHVPQLGGGEDHQEPGESDDMRHPEGAVESNGRRLGDEETQRITDE